MNDIKVIHVVDIESDIVKELLIFRIKSLRDSLMMLTDRIQCEESYIKALKKEIKEIYLNTYANFNNLPDAKKKKLQYQSDIISAAERIAQAQSDRECHKHRVTPLYKEKEELKKELAYYNAVADAHQIKLYKR